MLALLAHGSMRTTSAWFWSVLARRAPAMPPPTMTTRSPVDRSMVAARISESVLAAARGQEIEAAGHATNSTDDRPAGDGSIEMDRCLSPASALVYMDGGDRSIWRELVRGLLRFGDRPCLFLALSIVSRWTHLSLGSLARELLKRASFPKIGVLITAGQKIAC